jgi:hypothetical protein
MYQNGEYGRFLALYLFHRTVIIGARSHGEPEVS